MAAARGRMSLFDVHCHLQDGRILAKAPALIQAAADAGVEWMAVNGTSEGDWQTVKQMGEDHPSIIPCFGLHPWWVDSRSEHWLPNLRAILTSTPTAAVGEVGLCLSKRGRLVDLAVQVSVLREQLLLARELQRPVAVHCVQAAGPLAELLEELGHFPAGIIMHSFIGSQEQVKRLAKHGAYFSFSGFATHGKRQKTQRVWRAVGLDRVLLETDSPDALPELDPSALLWVQGDPDAPAEATGCQDEGSGSQPGKGALNQPANVRALLTHVASLLETSEHELAENAFRNSQKLFSYPGSKLLRL